MEVQNELIPLELGELLRQAREKKQLSLLTASQSIKTRPEVLAAIESGETDDIPSVYLKGYIRNYARYLGVPAGVIEQHMHPSMGHDPGVQTIFKAGPPKNSGDRWIKASSYVLASAVVIALVWQFTTEAVRFSQGDPLLRPTLESRADNTGATPMQGTAVDTDAAGAKAPAGPAKSHLRASIASMNSGSEQASAGRPVAAEGAWAAISNRDPAPADNPNRPTGPAALEILTSADSWVEITDGSGATIEMDLLRAGSRRNYNGSEPFQLLLGRASSVEVFHNGEKVDLAPYIRGNVARLTLQENPSPPATEQD